MRTQLTMAAMLIIALTSLNAEAQRRNADGTSTQTEKGSRRNSDSNTKAVERRNEVKQEQKVTEVHVSREKVVYKKSPRVKVVRILPATYHRIHHHNYEYYENEGRYYNFNNGKYILIAPPVGLRVRYLPLNYVRLVLGNKEFFYCNGVFYNPVPYNDEYEIIDPPIGAIVSDLPFDANKIEIDERIYYEYNNTIYKKIRTEYGRAYEVVGKL